MNEKEEKNLYMDKENPYIDYTKRRRKKRFVNKYKNTKAYIIIKKTILLALSVFMAFKLINFGIVMHNKSKYRNPQFVQQDIMNYLEDRYGEEFVMESYMGRGYSFNNYVQMYVYPKGKEDELYKFKVQGYFDKKGKMNYYDGYVMVKLRDDYENGVRKIIDEHFKDYKFYLDFYSEWITNNLPPDTQLDDLWNYSANVDYPLPRLCIMLKKSQESNFNKERIKKMGHELGEWGFRGEIWVYLYFDDTYYDKKNNYNKWEVIEGERHKRESHRMFVYDQNKVDYR